MLSFIILNEVTGSIHCTTQLKGLFKFEIITWNTVIVRLVETEYGNLVLVSFFETQDWPLITCVREVLPSSRGPSHHRWGNPRHHLLATPPSASYPSLFLSFPPASLPPTPPSLSPILPSFLSSSLPPKRRLGYYDAIQGEKWWWSCNLRTVPCGHCLPAYLKIVAEAAPLLRTPACAPDSICFICEAVTCTSHPTRCNNRCYGHRMVVTGDGWREVVPRSSLISPVGGWWGEVVRT